MMTLVLLPLRDTDIWVLESRVTHLKSSTFGPDMFTFPAWLDLRDVNTERWSFAYHPRQHTTRKVLQCIFDIPTSLPNHKWRLLDKTARRPRRHGCHTTRKGHQKQHCETQRSIKNTFETVPLQSVTLHYHSRMCWKTKPIHMFFGLQFSMLTITSSVMFCHGKTHVIQTHHLPEGSWSRDRCSHCDVIYLRTLYSQHSLRATKPSDLCRRESVHRQNTGTKLKKKKDVFMKHLAKGELLKTRQCQKHAIPRHFTSVQLSVSNSGIRFGKQWKILIQFYLLFHFIFFYTFQTCSDCFVTITSGTL